MRKIMLAATAISGLAALAAGQANAQMPNQGVVTTNFGNPTFSGGFPEPGTVTVYLKTRVEAQIGVASDSTQNVATAGKTGGVQVQDYIRIYPGFDGKTNGGLEYGTGLEIRQQNANNGNASSTTAGVSSTTGSGLFFRREGAYVGTATLGRFWIGEIDNALSRMNVGVTVGPVVGDPEGGWNGSTQRMVSIGSMPSYMFPGNGSAFYGANKIAYFSPSFAGFDLGVSYEPTNTTGEDNCGLGTSAPTATSGCANLQSSTTSSPILSRKNTVDAALRYKGSFGPAAVVGTIGTMQSGVVGTTATVGKAKGLNIVDVSGEVTVGPVTVGGVYLAGAINGDDGLLRQGQKNATAFLFGATYKIGQVILGAQYFNEQTAGYTTASSGAVSNANSMLHETGLSLGATYDYAPGAAVFVNALYGTRHQNNVNLQAVTSTTYAAGGTAGNLHNSTVARAIAIGNVFVF